jgi:hypothetical protein
MSEIDPGQILDQQIAYEGLRESITQEIGHQIALMRQEGIQEEARKRHETTAKNLVEIRRIIKPGDAETIEVANLFLNCLASESFVASSSDH